MNLLSTPAAAVAAVSSKVRLALLATAVVMLPACSSEPTATVTASGMVQNLTVDPAGQTIVTNLSGFEGAIDTSSVEASGLQTPVTVTVTGPLVVIAFDAVVSPAHQVRFTGLSGVSDEWRNVVTSDPRDTSFAIDGATQDTSDLVLGGDTISVQFYAGPRVLQADVEDTSNWTLSVGGTTMDLAGTTISFDDSTQVASITLGSQASLHASFTLSCTVDTVADTSVSTHALTGVATGDTSAPSIATVTQDLDPTTGDEFGRVLVFDFDEPISPVFGALPSNLSVVDHVNALGVTLPTNVEFEAGDDTQLRVNFSRPVVPGLDQIFLNGVVDAHGNAIVPITSPIAAGSLAVNSFVTVDLETVEGVGNDRIVATTTQALDPDTAANDDRWLLTVGGLGNIDLSTQGLTYDYLTRTMTIQLDFDVVNGTTGDLSANGAVDVDGESFALAAPQALAAGDTDSPGVSSLTQNRVVDSSGKTLDVVFTEDVDLVTATDTANYTFSPALNLTGASILAGNIVRIQTDATALPGDYTLTVAQAITDPAGNDLGAPFGPAAFSSTDAAAPESIASSGTAVEGGGNDRITVLFDDDMVPAEAEDSSNWTVESPIGTPLDLTGSTISYSVPGAFATVTLDGPGAASLVRTFDVQATFAGMRDLGGNTVTATPIVTSIQGETNRPAMESAFIVVSSPGDELTLRFSEPMRRLTDLYDPVSNPTGVQFTVIDPVTSTPAFPVTATELDGGLGVNLTFAAVIDPGSTVDVVGLVDLAGNVLFPIIGTSLDIESTNAPSMSSAVVSAIQGTDNDEVTIAFAEPMSSWGITSPEAYTVTGDISGNVSAVTNAQIEFDGLDEVIIRFAAGTNFNLSTSESYTVDLAPAPSISLRTKLGVPFVGPVAGILGPVVGDLTGPTPGACLAIADLATPGSVYVIFDESVDVTAAVQASHYTYDSTTVPLSAVLVDPRVVHLTFLNPVAPAAVIDVDAAVVDTAGNAATGALQISLTTDSQAPSVLTTSAVVTEGFGGDYIDVTFDEVLDPSAAGSNANYLVSSAGSDLRLLGVDYDSVNSTVRLLVEDMVEGSSVQLTISNLADFSGNVQALSPVAIASGDAVAPSINSGLANLWWDAAGTTVDVRFSEDVDYTFTEVPSNWTTSGSATVAGAEAITTDHVRLTLTEALGAGDTLNLAAGLMDSAGNAAGGLSIDPSN